MTYLGAKRAARAASCGLDGYQAEQSLGLTRGDTAKLSCMLALLCLAADQLVNTHRWQSAGLCQKPHMLWQVSILNFLQYNVKGGGDSALYGVEPATFYLRNGLNNLNLVLPLAMAYPVVAVLHLLRVTGEQSTAVLARPAELNADAAGCVPASLQHFAVTGEGCACNRAGRTPVWQGPLLLPAPVWHSLYRLPVTVWPAQTALGAASPHTLLQFLALFGDCRRLVSNEYQWPDRMQASFHHAGDGFDHRLAVALSSVFVWLAAISALPHKEERFLYVVYPLVSRAFS